MNDNPINPHDAPEGYVARPEVHACDGCAFAAKGDPRCADAMCMPFERADERSVIFTPRAEPGE